MIEYLQNNQEKYLRLLSEHIRTTLIALVVSLVLGIAIGFLIYKKRWLSTVATSIAGGFRVIPSLVLMLLFMPIIKTGDLSAVVSLVLIGLPNVLANTISGLSNTPADILESAASCGMSERQTFWKVRLPLALPTIITGMRMSSLSIAAGATLAAYVGAGGLGELILSGISQYRFDILLAGAITIVVICILLELFFQFIYLLVTRYRREEV